MTASSLLVEPAFRSSPPFVTTLGDEVADLADHVGFTPDPEQRLGLDLLFARSPSDPARLSACFEFAVICSRQNLKTGLFKQAALGWLYITEQQLVVWSAHEFRTAQEAFRDMEALIGGSEYLSRRLKRVYRGSGAESIELTTGQRLIFKARTKSGGRGLTGDKVVLDEAFALQPDHMGALLPTLSVRPDPQVVYGSSAGLADSDVLRGVRDRGRPGTSSRLAYLEWCAPEGGCADGDRCDHSVVAAGCALDDPAMWALSNPLLGRRRANGTGLTPQYVADERQALPPAEFARERLGWWDDPESLLAPITRAAWALLAVDLPTTLESKPVFFLDASPGLVSASIGVAAMVDGRPHLELADHDRGADWLVARALDLRDRHPGASFAVLGMGAAGALLPDLKERGLEPESFTSQDMGRACAHLQKLVADGAVSHSGDPLFGHALGVAVPRDIGDDLWTWSRRKSTGDISPLVAVTGAAWLLASMPDETPAIY